MEPVRLVRWATMWSAAIAAMYAAEAPRVLMYATTGLSTAISRSASYRRSPPTDVPPGESMDSITAETLSSFWSRSISCISGRSETMAPLISMRAMCCRCGLQHDQDGDRHRGRDQDEHQSRQNAMRLAWRRRSRRASTSSVMAATRFLTKPPFNTGFS